ncbi:MAG: M15 family metallopeptidase [Oscillospiraceae bacterium]|jgi:LAS superfamily LD-carboxypeptidase LdcB|nr:M15 family metallopeptidase [Oscillospiraceae bacterium]
MVKVGLFALYCIIIVVLSACSGPLLYIPFEYADIPAQPDGVFLQSGSSGQDAAPRASVKTVPAPSPSPLPEKTAPDIDDVIELASESLEGGDDSLFTDLSVSPDNGIPAGPVSELLIYPHYIARNELRYQTFIASFPARPVESALALVNVNADYGYYSGVSLISKPDNLLVLCNKNYQLPNDYVPDDMRNIAGTSHKMTAEAAGAFERMKQAVRDELGLPLVVLSGYRSYSYQEALYGRYVSIDGVKTADTYSARAGHSEHQTGLAVDFLQKTPSGSLRGAGFQNTAQYAWLQAHAHEYGFILRYPEGYESITGYRFEPWHWRYIGVDDAARMVEEGFATFEEYIGTYYPPGVALVREAG